MSVLPAWQMSLMVTLCVNGHLCMKLILCAEDKRKGKEIFVMFWILMMFQFMDMVLN